MTLALSDLERSFARYLRAEGCAQGTVKLHCQAPRFFAAWLITQGKAATLDELTRDNLIGWFAYLSERFQPGTVQVRFMGMGRFCRWLIDEDELADNPLRGLRRPEVPEKPVPVLTDNELVMLIKACQGKDFADRRDEAIIRFLLDCGVRVSELCGVTLNDLDLDNGAALVTGKRGKKRMVYFGARTERALDRYLRLRSRHRWAHLDAVFLGERGALTTDGVRYRMEVRAEQAGLKDPSNPHRFRHTFAHDFLLAGGQERDLKRLAGWSSDVMLERYGMSAADARAAAAVRKLRRGDRV